MANSWPDIIFTLQNQLSYLSISRVIALELLLGGTRCRDIRNILIFHYTVRLEKPVFDPIEIHKVER